MNPHQKTEELSAARTLTALCKSPSISPAPMLPQMPPLNGLPGADTLPMQQVPVLGTQQTKEEQSKPKDEKIKKNFPEKLFEILENPDHSEILKWLPGGKAFIIMDKKRFASDLLPHYFKQTQFTSFTRKLSRWKFVRVPRGPFMGAYYHKLFRKDHKALCKLMSCNNDAPNLAVIAQARQQVMDSATARDISNAMGLSSSQQKALKSLEEINRVSMIKEQLLQLRLRRAQLYEQQKRILLKAQQDRVAAGLQRMRQMQQQQQSSDRSIASGTNNQGMMNLHGSNANSMINQQGQFAPYAKLEQNGMTMNPVAATRAQMGQSNAQRNFRASAA